MHHIMPVHQWMDIWLVTSFCLLWRRLLWTLLHLFLFECLLSILLVIYLGLGFLGQTVTPCVTSWGAATVLSTVAVPRHSSLRRFRFLHILSTLATPLFYYYDHPKGHEGVSYCAFHLHVLATNVEHSFNRLMGHLYIFFGEMSIRVLCPF